MFNFFFLEAISQDIIVQIIIFIIVAILSAISYISRRRISNWWFGRKIEPKFKKAYDIYEKEILPEYVDTKPKIEIIEEKSQMPTSLPFGYIFIPKGQEELIWQALIAYLPVSSSLKRIRVLFDKDLRESLFDLLSYQLGMKLGKEEIAVNFRDLSLEKHKEDYEAVEKIYNDGKLTTIILWEASLRFRKTRGNITANDVEEFSKLVRKISKIDAMVVRIGDLNPDTYVNDIIKSNRNAILLARGTYVSKAVDVASQLMNKGYELFTQQELEFCNPEIGTWHFEKQNRTVSFIRIWLKKKVQQT